ncbi:unnamed protein product [Hapterophycus canaliculatus]
MRKTLASLDTLLALLNVLVGDALCAQSFLSIDSTTVTFSGCYEETIYAGTYETKVWTIGGGDIAAAGTKAIVADLQNGPLVDPVWVLGVVVSLPQNTWSDGYSAGLEVVEVACRGTSAFWETIDPTEEIQWECDSNGDGVFSIAESGDFQKVDCGCPGVTVATPTPAPIAGTIGVTGLPVQVPTAVPQPAVAMEPTPAPAPVEPAVQQLTQAPVIGGPAAPTTQACNLTLSSTELQDVSGCYVGQESLNARGRWVKLDNSASIEWQDATGSSEDGNWAVVLIGFNNQENKCIASQDVDDPTEIPGARWYCDLEGGGVFTTAGSFDFEGLQCSEVCDIETSVGALDGDSSDGSTGRTIGIAVGSVVAGVGVTALIIFGALFLRKRKTRDAAAKGVESGGGNAPADANAPEPVPVFEPWGTRPAPRSAPYG